jgi:hypothetical protein
MKLQNRLLTAGAVVAVAFLTPSSQGLVSLEDGKDHIFVDGSVEVGYDSNVFANAQSGGSMTYQGTLGMEFTRRAGWIGVNASASLDWARYANFRDQDYVDPKFTAELTKQTGRTTGSLTLSAQRINRADVTVNTRDTSWVYDVGFNFQYPVIERYSIAGSFDYNRIDYLDQALFTNLTTYTENVFLYYILNEQRDLFVNYRLRTSDEEGGSYDVDNSLSAGVSGRVYGPFNGSLQAGYETRSSHGGPDNGEMFDDITVSGAATWNIDRRHDPHRRTFPATTRQRRPPSPSSRPAPASPSRTPSPRRPASRSSGSWGRTSSSATRASSSRAAAPGRHVP